MAKYAAALDQGTTSSRAMVFNHEGRVESVAQKEHEQIYPKPGWVEHDAKEIWARSQEVLDEALEAAGASTDDVAALGITNQRETTVVWDRNTGEPIHNALVWQDTRTDKIVDELSADGGQARFHEKVGLPLATYFSGPKVRWILDNVDGARDRAEAGDLAFGNMDTWLIWNLTGGTDGGLHITDVTNASRTMLMDLKTLVVGRGHRRHHRRANRRCSPRSTPRARSTARSRPAASPASRSPATSATSRRPPSARPACRPARPRTPTAPATSSCSTRARRRCSPRAACSRPLGYKIGDNDAIYCLEGAIAITGALVQWLRDNLKLIKAAPEVEELAQSVEDNGGLYIVPAFSGLFAPYWKSNARGVFAGLTRYVNAGHIARATLEATAFQSREIVEAMNQDSGVDLESLKVDGGMVQNDLLMQFQADLLGVPVIRPVVAETTALGAAYAAGLATGFWASEDDIRNNWAEDKRWEPQMDSAKRDEYYKYWKKAVTRTFDWFDSDS